MENTVKLILVLIMLLANNIVQASSNTEKLNNINLAPENIPALALIDIYENRSLLAVHVDTLLESQTHNEDGWISTISIIFQHDRPGLLYDLLDRIDPDSSTANPKGTILWHEMIKENDKYCFRFRMNSKTKQDADLILTKIKTIPDEKNKNYERIKHQETYKCLLQIEIPTSIKILKHISHFLKINTLNNSSFLTPTDRENIRTLVLEIEVPYNVLLEQLSSKLNNFIKAKADEYVISLKEGNLIVSLLDSDRLLDKSLMKNITTQLVSAEELDSSANQMDIIRKDLRTAFEVIADKHISQSRKDQKTPYIMHQIDIINILINEFQILDPEILNFITEKIEKQSFLETASMILESIILHDALEDGDISFERLLNNFEPFVCDIVNRLTKKQNATIKNQENSFIEKILSKDDIQAKITQIIKLGDRLQSLRTLDGVDPVFQRKIFFKTLNYFIPEFVNQLSTDDLSNGPLNQLMKNAIDIFRNQTIETGKKYGFLDQAGEVIEEQQVRYKKEEHIMNAIQKTGRINFAEYMHEVLYGKYGFYTKDISIGRNKDFDTFAENIFFADCTARQLIEMWENMGKPDNFPIIEMGAGSGTLATNVLSAIKRYNPELFKKVDYKIIEISPKLVKDQKDSIRNKFGSLKSAPISWMEGSVETEIPKLNNIEGVFLSNELVDQFPVHRVKFIDGVAKEVYVTFKNGQFQEELGELSSMELEEYIKTLDMKVPDGVELPVNLIMHKWQKDISKALKKGYIFTIDYGGKTEHIINAHPAPVFNLNTDADKNINSFEEVMRYFYANTSMYDMTSEPNHYDIAKEGEKNGITMVGYTKQRVFLDNLGIDEIVIDGKLISLRELRGINNNPHFNVMIQSTKDVSNKLLTGMRDEGTIAKHQFYNKGLDIDSIIKRLIKTNYIDQYYYVNKDNYVDDMFMGLDQQLFQDLTTKQIEQIENIFKYALSPRFPSSFHYHNLYLQLPLKIKDADFVLITKSSQYIPKEEFEKGPRNIIAYVGYPNKDFELFMDVQAQVDKDGNYVLPISLNQLSNIKIWNNKGEIIFNFTEYFEHNPEAQKRLLVSQDDFDEEYGKDLDLTTPEEAKIPSYIIINEDGSCAVANSAEEPTYFKPEVIETYTPSKKPKRLCYSSS